MRSTLSSLLYDHHVLLWHHGRCLWLGGRGSLHGAERFTHLLILSLLLGDGVRHLLTLAERKWSLMQDRSANAASPSRIEELLGGIPHIVTTVKMLTEAFRPAATAALQPGPIWLSLRCSLSSRSFPPAPRWR